MREMRLLRVSYSKGELCCPFDLYP